jgi:MFS family permease
MNVYMLVSILAAGWTADLLGRRGTLVLANGFLMAGALAMSLGGSYAALMAARFVTSIGVGFSLVVAPVYNAEISPASVRGVLSSLLDVSVPAVLCLSVGGSVLMLCLRRFLSTWASCSATCRTTP